MNTVKKTGRPPLNNPADVFLHMRCRKTDKAEWLKASDGGCGLSAWVVKTLNEAAKVK